MGTAVRCRSCIPCRYFTALAGVVMVCCGCATTHAIDTAARSPEAHEHRAEINARASASRVGLSLNPGPLRIVRSLRVGPDSTSWVTASSYETVATSSVTRVQVVNRGRGALDGLALGLLGGGVLGAVSYEGPDLFIASRGATARVGAVFLSFITAPLGLLTGVATGHREVYMFPGETMD